MEETHPRLIVADAGPLIALSKVGELILLQRIFGNVSIPRLRPLLDGLRGIGYYLSDGSAQTVLAAVGEAE